MRELTTETLFAVTDPTTLSEFAVIAVEVKGPVDNPETVTAALDDKPTAVIEPELRRDDTVASTAVRAPATLRVPVLTRPVIVALAAVRVATVEIPPTPTCNVAAVAVPDRVKLEALTGPVLVIPPAPTDNEAADTAKLAVTCCAVIVPVTDTAPVTVTDPAELIPFAETEVVVESDCTVMGPACRILADTTPAVRVPLTYADADWKNPVTLAVLAISPPTTDTVWAVSDPITTLFDVGPTRTTP